VPGKKKKRAPILSQKKTSSLERAKEKSEQPVSPSSTRKKIALLTKRVKERGPQVPWVGTDGDCRDAMPE